MSKYLRNFNSCKNFENKVSRIKLMNTEFNERYEKMIGEYAKNIVRKVR